MSGGNTSAQTLGRSRRPLAALASLTLAVLGAVAVTFFAAGDGAGAREGRAAGDGRPNILFVITDDMNENQLPFMPVVSSELQGGGMTFSNAFVTHSLCCPSRASILRGQYSHNHGVQSNALPDGGEGFFRQRGLDQSTFATWLDGAGYRTGLVGKYLTNAEGTYVPPGWDSWFGVVGTPEGRVMNDNGVLRQFDPSEHSTDVYRQEAMRFLDGATDGGEDPPFMLWVGTYAPHENSGHAARHDGMFSQARLPIGRSYNERDVSDKPRWVRRQPRLTRAEFARLQGLYREQLRSLQAVDEMVGAMLGLLRERGELKNTYVVFTSDNGLHFGEHRLERKRTPYDEATGVPLVVRGPGVPTGAARGELVANNDLAPTFAQVGGAPIPSFVDGRSLMPLLSGGAAPWRSALLIERRPAVRDYMPDYSAVRTQKHLFVRYQSGERELYDLRRDPRQLESIEPKGRVSRRAHAILQARLVKLATCAGEACRQAEGP